MNTRRRLEELTESEHEVLRALRERISVGCVGTTALARRITGDPKLQPRDEITQVVYHLMQEEWIVFEKDRKDNFAIYSVAADYPAFQPA